MEFQLPEPPQLDFHPAQESDICKGGWLDEYIAQMKIVENNFRALDIQKRLLDEISIIEEKVNNMKLPTVEESLKLMEETSMEYEKCDYCP